MKYRNKKIYVFIQCLGPNGERIKICKPVFFSISNSVPTKEEVSLSTSLLKRYSQFSIPHPCAECGEFVFSVCMHCSLLLPKKMPESLPDPEIAKNKLKNNHYHLGDFI